MANKSVRIYALALAIVFIVEITEANEMRGCEVDFRCICNIGEKEKSLPVHFQLPVTFNAETGTMNCGKIDGEEACANMSCKYSKNKRSVDEDYSIEHEYPQVFKIFKGDVKEGHRFVRDTGSCQITRLSNAEITCYLWPEWMNCDIKCLYGYALENRKGKTLNSTNINCRFSKGIWKPHGFIDCQPFLNCGAQLVKPGGLFCKQPDTGPSFCDIYCDDYNQNEATGSQRYECIDETFPKILPHCAALKKNVKLLSKPVS